MDRLSRTIVCAVIAIMAVAMEWPVSAVSQGRPLYVSITNSKGEPQAGVTEADLVIEVNGKIAPVARVAPANEPLSIVVVTEGIRQDAISEIRRMMKAVVVGARAVHPDSRVGLMIEDGAAQPKMYAAAADAGALDATIARFFESSRNSPLLDSIMTAAHTLSFEKHARRVIVAVTRGQADAQADVMSPMKVAQAVRASGASLWALDLGGREAPTGAAEERVLADVTAISGGRQERSTISSIASLTERIMATLRGQYAITLEDGIAPKAASPKVTARSKDLKVLAPAWPAVK
jgi:hypothetical protein